MSLPRMLAFCAVVALTATAIIPGVASAQKRSGTLVNAGAARATDARVRRSPSSGSVIRT